MNNQNTTQTTLATKVGLSSLNQILVTLLVIQIGIVTFMFWPQNNVPTGDVELLTGISLDDVTSLTLVDADNNQVTLEKTNGQWVLANSDGFPADKEKVDEVVNKLLGVKGNRLVTRTAGSHKRLQVAEDDFVRRVVLSTAQGSHTLYIGSTPSAQATHIRLQDQDETYLTSEVTSWELNPQTSNWIDTLYFSATQDEVVGLMLQNANGSLNFERNEANEWILSDLAADEAMNTAQVNTLLNQITNIRMVTPLGQTADANFGLDSPQATVVLTIRDSEGNENSPVLRLGAKGEETENYYFKVSSSPYYVSIATFTGDALTSKSRADFIAQPTPEAEVPLDGPIITEGP